jgi:hypothetical protein
MKKLTLFLLLWVLFLLIPHEADATFELLDGKLRIKGRFEQYMVFLYSNPHKDSFYRNRDRLDVNQSIFTLEGLYTLVDNGEWLVNFQSYLRYYYESAPDMDHRLQRSFSTKRRMYKKYMTNRYDNDDWINEMYVDMYKGPWNIRLGKQVVVWSEVEMVQTIDKINPIDLRYATPGIQPFDELKLSLWMFRGFYNSDLPGNLIFEHIFIPGDFERTRTPFEGTWSSRRPAPGEIANAPGQGDAVYWMMDQAMPQWSLSNYQYAFRIRGNSEIFFFDTPYIIDWTVSYWNGLDTGHAVFEDTERVNAALTRNASFRAAAGMAGPPLPYGRDVASWKRYEAVGASFQTYVPPLGGVLRGELSYEIGRKWNSVDPYASTTAPRHPPRRVGDVGTFEDRTIERDFLSYGITIDKPFCVPFYGNLMQRWGVRPCWDMTFGFFQGYWMGDVKRVWQWSSGYGYQSNTFFTMMIRGGFRHNEFIPVIRAKYSPRNFGYVSPGITYMPGKHVRVQLGSIWFYGNNPAKHREAAVEYRDMVYMRFRYEY